MTECKALLEKMEQDYLYASKLTSYNDLINYVWDHDLCLGLCYYILRGSKSNSISEFCLKEVSRLISDNLPNGYGYLCETPNGYIHFGNIFENDEAEKDAINEIINLCILPRLEFIEKLKSKLGQ